MTQPSETQSLILLPQVTAMLTSEAYHYCADCEAHCRQLILTIEALKELNRAYTLLIDTRAPVDNQGADDDAKKIVDTFEELRTSASLIDVEVSYDYLRNAITSGQSNAATQMRTACVEKVRAMRDEWQAKDPPWVSYVNAANHVITALAFDVTLEGARPK